LGSNAPADLVGILSPLDADREALARLLLDAYRGTIDDEGEGETEARAAIAYYLERLLVPYSLVVEEGHRPVCLCLVVLVDGRHYIDPVATATDHKGQGLATRAVTHSLHRLHRDGITEVGAVVTDGNTASERLFDHLGFTRVGPWPS
jgi:ribosomal protein S18 acetylase RimI-like enzyme